MLAIHAHQLLLLTVPVQGLHCSSRLTTVESVHTHTSSALLLQLLTGPAQITYCSGRVTTAESSPYSHQYPSSPSFSLCRPKIILQCVKSYLQVETKVQVPTPSLQLNCSKPNIDSFSGDSAQLTCMMCLSFAAPSLCTK